MSEAFAVERSLLRAHMAAALGALGLERLLDGELTRGGFSATNPRFLATVTYSSPASLASLKERSYHYTGAIDEPTRFAVT